MKQVGLLCGRESAFPTRFLEEVNGRNAGVNAEFVKLGGTKMDEPIPYAVIVDRISHEVPYYRSYLKHAVIAGVAVINNPFMWSADDKFLGASLAAKLGVAHPKTLVLPNKDYVPGIVKSESLRNLIYPLDWQYVVDYVRLPCILKDAHGGGWRGVYVCNTRDELIRNYDSSGMLTMIAQEYIQWDHYVRCMCIGQSEILLMPFDPATHRYTSGASHLDTSLQQRLIDDSIKLAHALGYDMNMVEWAIHDGNPYAIDFMNPAPDMDINNLTHPYFEWTVRHMADLVISRAHTPQSQLNEFRWSKLF